MTTYEQIKEVMKGKKGMVVTSAFIKKEVNKRYGVDVSSVIPSDFCYNRRNDGIKFTMETRIFKYLGKGAYEYLGENYAYSGEVYQKRQGQKTEKIVGYWVNGIFKDAL